MQKIRTTTFFILTQIIISCQSFNELLEEGKKEFEKEYSEQNYEYAISVLEKATKKREKNQEAHYFLGYAYDRHNFTNLNEIDKLKLNYTEKSSEQFEKAITISPKYNGELLSLDPYSKITSLWGIQALSYFKKNETDSVIWAFEQGKIRGGFDPLLIEFNKNLLNSCDSNAILFSSGDEITLGCLYLQNILNFRKDIVVIDYGLMHTKWYPKILLQRNLIQYSISETHLDSLPSIVSWQNTQVSIKSESTSESDLLDYTWNVPPTMDNNFISRAEYLMLDILKANKFRRPVYFSTGFDKDHQLNLQLQDIGLVNLLCLDYCEEFPNKFSNNLREYDYDQVRSSSVIYSSNLKVLIDIYRYDFLNLISYQIKSGKLDKALSNFLYMELVIPPNEVPFSSKEMLLFYENVKSHLTL